MVEVVSMRWYSMQSVFYRNPAIIDENNKPQINADERRCIPAMDYIKTTHCKGRKECKAAQQEPLCPLCSLWLNASSAPAHERAACACRSYAVERRGGMSIEDGRMKEIGNMPEEYVAMRLRD